MKVGITGLVTPADWTFEETLEKIKAAGYESFEIAVRDDGPITLSTSQTDLQAMAGRASDIGILLDSSCPAGIRNDPKDLMTDDAMARAKGVDTWKRCIDLVHAMGIDTMLVVLGALPPDLYYNRAYANALQSMQQLAPHAEQAGVSLAIEYVWNKFLLSPMECALLHRGRQPSGGVLLRSGQHGHFRLAPPMGPDLRPRAQNGPHEGLHVERSAVFLAGPARGRRRLPAHHARTPGDRL